MALVAPVENGKIVETASQTSVLWSDGRNQW